MDLKTRFLRHVEKSPNCWMWTGQHTPGAQGGYGRLRIKGIETYAHRISYELFIGKIPRKRWVCHSCDVRLCVNPKHLFLGSAAENVRDMVSKGRQARGERNGSPKLTAQKVRKIRTEYARGESQPYLAQEYGVSQMLISKIVRRLKWRHI